VIQHGLGVETHGSVANFLGKWVYLYRAVDKEDHRTHKTHISIKQCQDLNNIVEQDHRAIKRLSRPTLDLKSFWAARCTIAGMEVMHAIRKGQLATIGTVS
jgi:transposase-like protein